MLSQNPHESIVPATSLQEWLHQGEALYNNAVREYHELDAQIEQLEQRLAAKQSEVNQIATVIGKPTVEGNRRLSAQLVTARTMHRDRERLDSEPQIPPANPAQVARALTGKFARGS